MSGGALIVTRPGADAGSLIEALQASGIESLAAPLIEIDYDRDVTIPDLPFQAILLSSANAARALARHNTHSHLRQVLTIAVGEASAGAARDAGQADVVAAGGDVAGLIATACKRCTAQAGPLLYLSGVHTTGDLEAQLTGHGYQVHRIAGYEAVAANHLPDGVHAAIAGQDATGVILYSPRTARIWCGLLDQAGLAGRGAELINYCLSDNVAAVIRKAFGSGSAIVTASEPNERAMLAAIAER